MSPEEIRNTLDDDADLSRSDMTLWRDRGQIIAAQQTRIAQLEAQVNELAERVMETERDWSRKLIRAEEAEAQVVAVRRSISESSAWSDDVGPCVGISELRDALNFPGAS